MKKNDYLIKVWDKDNDETNVHIKNIGPTDHVTMCGMDGGVAGPEQEIVPLQRGDKMNCHQCRTYYENRSALNIKKDWLEK